MIPVLSIRQPWAWLIVNGHKDIENRTWATQFRGRLLIHAGKVPDKWAEADYLSCEENHGIKIPRDLPLGGIVGEATIIDCVDVSDSPWFLGPFGFVLCDQKPLLFVPLRGRLGFFNVAPEILRGTEQ
ncbi:MAG: ASCH domain-containing protein [Rhodocyclaceae bacterium]|nr:ASCH domain-containing protein [Rhodocyclaceae bacterium]